MAVIHGGDKLRNALVKLTRNVSNGATLHVGFLSGATYPIRSSHSGKRRKRGSSKSQFTPVALVAAVHEFGAPSRNIPPRPFMRPLIKEKAKEWPGAIAALLKANSYDAKKTLMLAGEAISGQLRQAIRDVRGPPLKPATVKRKGFATLLIDTAHMINSVDYEVK